MVYVIVHPSSLPYITLPLVQYCSNPSTTSWDGAQLQPAAAQAAAQSGGTATAIAPGKPSGFIGFIGQAAQQFTTRHGHM